MYFLFGIFFVICAFFWLFGWRRRRRIICKVRDMDTCEKLCMLNDLIEPYGFSYNIKQDTVVTTVDAWQRQFGYRALFDKTAAYFNMVFDCEPVYFDYDGKTWLIELWKGQYGINTGSEVGVYHADSILLPSQYRKAHFKSASDNEMPEICSELYKEGKTVFTIREKHWWLAGFRMGCFSRPRDLSMRVSITFPNCCMMQSFVKALHASGYSDCALCICGLTVTVTFVKPSVRYRRQRLRRAISQWKNRLFCRIFCRITRPFSCTHDKLLYLYFYLPFAFRRMIGFRKNRRQKSRCRRKRQR